MRKTIFLSAGIGTVMVASAAATAGYVAWKNPSYAEVVSVVPIKQSIATSDKVCRNEQARRRKAATEESAAMGTVIDGMAGGQVNDRLLDSSSPDADTFVVAGRTCRASNRLSERIVAYEVRYRLHGKTAKVRMDHDPGPQLPVKNGNVVLTRDVAKRSTPKA